MQAIVTKYIGPTNTRGGRIKASCQARSIIAPWNHALNPYANHLAAAKALATKLAWPYGEWIAGELPSGQSVFVCNCANADRFTVSP
jgi:hypothetical protein